VSEREQAITPINNTELIGHDGAEQQMLQAYLGDRLPHAWLLGGPRGIGKATLAYRFARFLLSQSTQDDGLFAPQAPTSLALAPDERDFRMVAAGAHPGLRVVERGRDPKTGRLRSAISVDQIRDLIGFFTMTSAEGGWRVAIIDGADEMNRNAANAVLKLLEEPPAKSVIMLVSQGAGRMLATIRSRCRLLALRPLGLEDTQRVVARVLEDDAPDDASALARLADGSPGRAIALADAGGLDIYRQLIAMTEKLPAVPYQEVHNLADRFNRRDGAEAYLVWNDLFVLRLSRAIRTAGGAADAGEAVEGEWSLARRIADAGKLDRWVELWEKVRRLADQADGLNLERKQVVLNTFAALEATARENLGQTRS
jgi:DNA polymerase-3 subunit delta'